MTRKEALDKAVWYLKEAEQIIADHYSSKDFREALDITFKLSDLWLKIASLITEENQNGK